MVDSRTDEKQITNDELGPHLDCRESIGKLKDGTRPSGKSEGTDKITCQSPKNSNKVPQFQSKENDIDQFQAVRANAVICHPSNTESEQSHLPFSSPDSTKAIDSAVDIKSIRNEWNSLRERVLQNRAKMLKFREELDDLKAQVDRLELRSSRTGKELKEDMERIKKFREHLRKLRETFRRSARISARQSKSAP